MNFLLKQSLTVLGILLAFTLASQATNYTWTGTTSTDWGTAGNWSPSGVPGGSENTDNVTISACSGNAPILNATYTIAAFTMTGCALTINSGYTLNITGTTSITGSGTLITGAGTLNVGTSTTAVTVTIGSTSVLNGPTVSAATSTIYASLSESLSYIYNSTFGACSIFWLGSGWSSNGGNTFTGITYIGFSGFGGLNFGVNAGDTFEGQTTFSNTGSGASSVTISSNYSSTFTGDIIVACANTGGYGIVFGSPTGSATSTLASGYTISAGTFSSGFLKLYNFIQEGTTPQTLSGISSLYFCSGTTFNGPLTTIGNTYLYFNPEATFVGAVTASAAYLYLNGSHFENVTNLTETWGGNNSNGGNTFDGLTTINNNGGGGNMNLNYTSPDIYNGNVTYNNYYSSLVIGGSIGNTYNGTVTFNNNAGAGYLTASYKGTTHYNGDIIINNTNGYDAVIFGQGGGTSILDTGQTISADAFAVGTLSISNFTQLGSTPQNIILTGTAGVGFSNCTFNGPLTATAPVVGFSGNTFNNTVNFTTTATSASNTVYGSGVSISGGGNTFNFPTSIMNSSVGKPLELSTTTPDIFYSSLNLTCNSGDGITVGAGNTYNGVVTITNTGSSQGIIAMSNNNNTTSTFNGNIYVNNSSYYGISFGQGGGASVLSSGNTITAPTYTTSSLTLKNFTQQGSATAQQLDIPGGTLAITNSVFNGNFESTSLIHNIGTTQFIGSSSFTKTGTSTSSWAGGNIFTGAATFTNQNSGGWLELSTVADLFNSSVTFINNGYPGILVNYSSVNVGNTYNGTVTLTNNSTTGNISLNATSESIYSYYSGNIAINGTGATQNCGFNIGTMVFTGGNNQAISDSYSSGLTLTGNVIVNKSSGAITLNTPVTISGAVVTLNQGNIISASSSAVLTLTSTSSISGGSANSFISSPLSKIGNTAFTFPVGSGTIYAPVSITAATESNSTVVVQHVNTAPAGTISNYNLSSCQYWNVTRPVGTSAINLSLNWNPSSCEQLNTSILTVASVASSTNSSSNSWSTVTSSVSGENSEGSLTASSSSARLGITPVQISLASSIEAAICSSDVSQNWVEEIHYNQYGTIISDTRVYSDGMGRTIQTQTQNLETNNVIASATIYDTYGRAAIQTLPAAINATCFGFNSTFVTNNNTPYNYSDFDGTYVNSPKPVDNTTPLGAYYSTSNLEIGIPTSSYPYSRVFYNDNAPGGMVKTASAGESLRMGSGNEKKAIVLPLLTELDNNYILVRNNFVLGSPSSLAYQGSKTIVVDENGNGSVTFKSKEGQTLATAITNVGTINSRSIPLSGAFYYYNYTTNSNGYNFVSKGSSTLTLGNISGYQQLRSDAPFTVQVANQTFFPTLVPGIASVDIYCSSGFTLNAINAATDSVKITDLTNGNIVFYDLASNYTPITTAGYYRITLTYQAWASSYTPGELTVNYTDNFTNWAYYFYDNAGHLVAQTAPNGVLLNIYVNSTAYPSFTTTYIYDTQGRVLSKTDPDRGNTQYLYRADGRLRFSQNSQQAISGTGIGGTGRFTFINYDLAGRPIATGEYFDPANNTWTFENQTTADGSTTAYGVHNLLASGVDGNIFFNTAGTSSLAGNSINMVYTSYDVADPACPRTTQAYLAGAVSSTYRRNTGADAANVSQTWYSYDELNRTAWTVQSVNGLTGSKTMDYTYGLTGNLLSAVYQVGVSSEKFTHKYQYDDNHKLEMVSTAQGTNGFKEQAHYQYYNYGALQRTELGATVQGIDYTYTINGWLKAINNPVMSADPGQDGIVKANGITNGFNKDVFGMTLEYYDSDYVGANFQTTTNLDANFPNQYNGNVRSSVWTNQGTTLTMAQYAYTYDNKNQLETAIYGANSSQTFTPDAANRYKVYAVLRGTAEPLGYDLNGNVQLLARVDNNGNFKDNMQLYYPAGSNMLQGTLNYSTGTFNRTYTYDAIGRMTSCSTTVSTEITKYLTYDVYGNVTGAYASSGTSQPIVTYAYDDKGFRLQKVNYSKTTYQPVTTTYYIRDVAGNILSIYSNDNNSTGTMQQAELPIYGKSRVGNITIYGSTSTYDYEINDHLGNMRAVVSVSTGTLQVVSYADYYPHGGVLPTSGNPSYTYRYGYQGQYAEYDEETQWNSFDLRNYDPVTTRMITPDPMYASVSPYVAMNNNHVRYVDPTGGDAAGFGGGPEPQGSSSGGEPGGDPSGGGSIDDPTYQAAYAATNGFNNGSAGGAGWGGGWVDPSTGGGTASNYNAGGASTSAPSNGGNNMGSFSGGTEDDGATPQGDEDGDIINQPISGGKYGFSNNSNARSSMSPMGRLLLTGDENGGVNDEYSYITIPYSAAYYFKEIAGDDDVDATADVSGHFMDDNSWTTTSVTWNFSSSRAGIFGGGSFDSEDWENIADLSIAIWNGGFDMAQNGAGATVRMVGTGLMVTGVALNVYTNTKDAFQGQFGTYNVFDIGVTASLLVAPFVFPAALPAILVVGGIYSGVKLIGGQSLHDAVNNTLPINGN